MTSDDARVQKIVERLKKRRWHRTAHELLDEDVRRRFNNLFTGVVTEIQPNGRDRIVALAASDAEMLFIRHAQEDLIFLLEKLGVTVE